MYFNLLKQSKVFNKLAFYVLDEEDFEDVKWLFIGFSDTMKSNLDRIIKYLNKKITDISSMQSAYGHETEIINADLINLIITYTHDLINIDDLSEMKVAGIQFDKIPLVTVNFLSFFGKFNELIMNRDIYNLNAFDIIEQIKNIIEILISEFLKIRTLFDQFQPKINYIDQEHVDVDIFIISYLEFFIEIIEKYEDIFYSVENYDNVTQTTSKNLKKIKNVFRSKIEELQSRNQDKFLEFLEENNNEEEQE